MVHPNKHAAHSLSVSSGKQGPSSGTGADKPAPRPRPGALTALKGWSEGRGLVEVAAPLGLLFPALGAVAVAALLSALDLGRGPFQAGADLVGFDLGHRALVALGGVPAALAEPAGDHHPVALAEGVGQVLGLPTPDVDLEEAGVAVAPLAVLVDALGHGHAHVRDGDAVLGEAELGVFDEVADDGGVVVCCHDRCSLLVLVQRSGPTRSGPHRVRVGSARARWMASAARSPGPGCRRPGWGRFGGGGH